MTLKDIQQIAQRHTSHLCSAIFKVLQKRRLHATSQGKEKKYASMDRNPYTLTLSSQDHHQISGPGTGHLWCAGMEVEGVDDPGEIETPLIYLLSPRS